MVEAAFTVGLAKEGGETMLSEGRRNAGSFLRNRGQKRINFGGFVKIRIRPTSEFPESKGRTTRGGL